MPRIRIRMFPALLLAALLVLFLAFLAPQQAPIIAYKLALIFLAGFGGYWLARWAAPYARPDGYLIHDWHKIKGFTSGAANHPVAEGCQMLFIAALAFRALIMVGAMIAVGVGL